MCTLLGMDLGERIKTARKAAGLTQARLAELCGWDPPSRLGNYEQGTREPSLADLRLIAEHVAGGGHSYAWIVLGEEPVQASQSARPDAATISTAIQLSRRALENIGDHTFDPEQDGDLIVQAYTWLLAKKQTKVTRENVIDFAEAIRRRSGGGKDGTERASGVGKAGADGGRARPARAKKAAGA
jgi:transcriptional regulator with XRE-family HTH domain